jgi:hypothetical protein
LTASAVSGKYQITVYCTDGSSATVVLSAAELATASATYPLS